MEDMAQRCDAILDLLEREVILHKDLLDLSRREQSLLITLDVRALVAALRDMEELIGKLRATMQARSSLLAEMAQECGPGEDYASCEEVLSKAGRGRAERYANMLECLGPVLEEHAVINAGNIILVRNLLDYADFAAGFLASRFGQNTYAARKVGRPHALGFSRS